MEIVPLDPEKVALADLHLSRHILESGQHGVHWLPYDPDTLERPPTVKVDGLGLDFDRVGWERWHVVLDATGEVVGHVSLKGTRFNRGLHRCELGMGLEYPYRRRGLGTELLKVAIDQARSIRSLDWVDLHVLSSNQPAIHLYNQHGFDEISRVPDFCRIDGTSEDDMLMSLWVRTKAV